MSSAIPASVRALAERLEEASYFADLDLATSIFLSLELGKPLLLEGEAGVGKTEVAKVLARVLERPLIRLQCYEGLDLAAAAYEWDYSRQLLHIRLQDVQTEKVLTTAGDLYRREFLLARPLLQAIDLSNKGTPPILLIDELDRADEEFEAFLLELLSDFQITIPELGTVRAAQPPTVIVTSNRTREIHDALRRRCLYQWIDYPDAKKELRIVEAKAPKALASLHQQIVDFVQALRTEDLYKKPGVAETLDWAAALDALGKQDALSHPDGLGNQGLRPQDIERSLGTLLKYQDDVEQVRSGRIEVLLSRS